MLETIKKIPAALLIVVAAAAPLHPAHADAPLSLTDRDGKWTINNGRIEIVVNESTAAIETLTRFDNGVATRLDNGKVALYFDSNATPDPVPAGVTVPKKGYHRIDPKTSSSRIAVDNPDEVEVVVSSPWDPTFPFNVDVHYAVFKNDPGYYAYVTYHHGQGMPGAILYQVRFVNKVSVPDIFNTFDIDEDHIEPIPTATTTQTLADATYLLADGSVKTKYNQSVYWADHLAYGDTGPQFGLFAVTPSPEFFNAGPAKQGQTVHDDNVLRVLQSVHFGAPSVDLKANEEWQKVYGPFFVYTNSGPTPKSMLDDALLRQKQEAVKWPYSWVHDPAYSVQRGVVTGILRQNNGKPIAGAQAILSAPGIDWTRQSKGYEFWTTSDAEGRFTIPKVVPGNYTLYATGGDQPEQLVKNGITVLQDTTANLGSVFWKTDTNAKLVWQLGTFDRSAAEFRNGNDTRHFQLYKLYPTQFPNDVNYTIGVSDPSKDWNYAQWTYFSKKPYWTIRFNSNKPLKGDAILTIGIASALPAQGDKTDVLVKVNGTLIGQIQLAKTGTSGYRGGSADTQYNIEYYKFPAALVKSGWNEITLGHQNAVQFPADGDVVVGDTGQGIGEVMYDAIKLEVK